MHSSLCQQTALHIAAGTNKQTKQTNKQMNKQKDKQKMCTNLQSINVSICRVFFSPQMTPLDVAVRRGHTNVVNFLRGAGMPDVSTRETVL